MTTMLPVRPLVRRQPPSGSPRTVTAPTTPSTPTTSRAANASQDREFELDDSATAHPAASGPIARPSGSRTAARTSLFAHDLATGERLPDARPRTPPNATRDGREASGPTKSPCGCSTASRTASSPTTLASGERLAEYALDGARTDDPHGLWSDGVTGWVSNHDPKRLFAYRLPEARPRGGRHEVKAAEREPRRGVSPTRC